MYIFSCIFTLENRSKTLLCSMSRSFLSMISYRCLMASGLTLRSLMHLEFIFVRKCSNFVVLHVTV